MKKIPLTQGKYALVDDESFEYLSQWKWFAEKIGRTWYASRGLYDPIKKRHGKMLRMHRVIMKNPIKKLVDHKDRNGLNNQRCNLRVCTKSTNAMNYERIKSKTGYRGVCMTKNKWSSGIKVNYKRINLGVFLTPELAALAYNKAAIKYHKEFAILNEI